jgi:hypothetical protein
MKKLTGVLKCILGTEKGSVKLVIIPSKGGDMIELTLDPKDVRVPKKSAGFANLLRKEVRLWYRFDVLYEIELIPETDEDDPFIVWQLPVTAKSKVGLYNLSIESRNRLVYKLCSVIKREVDQIMPGLYKGMQAPPMMAIPSPEALLVGLQNGSDELKMLIFDLKVLSPGLFSDIRLQFGSITEEELRNHQAVSFEVGSKADDLVVSFGKIERFHRAGRQKEL